MTSLLPHTLYEAEGQAPSPSKDFHYFIVTQEEVIMRSWKIAVRTEKRTMLPQEVRKTHSEFLLEDVMHNQLQKIFGTDTVEYVLNLCKGHFDFLVRIPDGLKIYVMSFLDTNDIKRMSQTCKSFQKLCNSEELWEKVKSRQDTHLNAIHRTGFSGSMKKYNPKLHRPAWMQRRKSTFF
uniref:F-box domain-containing protein n=1 Tax=Leptobrachium leishanense TaxID=445787 RepID=A0A8C5MXV7_9ANUR